jgi:hypothetical protein
MSVLAVIRKQLLVGISLVLLFAVSGCTAKVTPDPIIVQEAPPVVKEKETTIIEKQPIVKEKETTTIIEKK